MTLVNQSKREDFRLDEFGVLRFRDRVCVPDLPELKRRILEEGHRSTLSIHPGAAKMYQDLKKLFWWPGMKKSIAEFVYACLVCQKSKIEHQKPSGALQPLFVPEWKWDSISMDFVVGFPKSSKGWGSLQRAMGMKLRLSYAYHRQTDGQSERTIQSLEDLLRACVLEQGVSWSKCLPLVEFTYNNSFHSSIGMAPFEALYGRRCRTPLCWYETGENALIGPEIIQQTSEKGKLIQEKM